MNIIFLLSLKKDLVYLQDEFSIRQAIEKFKVYHYTAIPVIDSLGKYLGTVSEGDFLYYILEHNLDMKSLEKVNLKEVIREDFNPAVKIDATMEQLLDRVMNQNFVPVVDDIGTFMGIITRKSVINYFMEKKD